MNSEEDFIDGEVIHQEIKKSTVSDIMWRTKDKTYIRVGDMADSHIRNSALFLMGMGYQVCTAPTQVKLIWLKVFNMEWQKRMYARQGGLKVWIRVSQEPGEETVTKVIPFIDGDTNV